MFVNIQATAPETSDKIMNLGEWSNEIVDVNSQLSASHFSNSTRPPQFGKTPRRVAAVVMALKARIK